MWLPHIGLHHADPPDGHGAAICSAHRCYGRGVLGDVVGDCGAGPIIPPGIILPGVIWLPGPIIAPGFIRSSGFIICSPGFIWLQQAIGPGPIWSPHGPPRLQLRRNPEKKIAATMNKPRRRCPPTPMPGSDGSAGAGSSWVVRS